MNNQQPNPIGKRAVYDGPGGLFEFVITGETQNYFEAFDQCPKILWPKKFTTVTGDKANEQA